MDAAHIAVQEDGESLEQVCRWFRTVFPKEDFGCDARRPETYVKRDLAIERDASGYLYCKNEARPAN